jgi:alginate O-acetyltransferase complex protein AlgI
MLWLAVPCYAAQIYCDFSGYTDMALGAAHAFGFKLPQNFNRPYFADSIGEFWRRWHITLSSWLRDYIYIPLGGSRGSPVRTYRNIVLTFTLCGLWHGAAWQYVIFGLYHGILLSIERAFPLPAAFNAPFFHPLKVARTFLLLLIGVVIFRAHAISDAWLILQHMARPVSGNALSPDLVYLGLVVLVVVFAGHALGTVRSLPRLARRIHPVAMGVALACFFLLIQMLIPAESAAFVYFQF